MSGPTTILHLSTAATWRGGEQQAASLMAGLAAHGLTSVLAAPPAAPLARRAAAQGIRVEALQSRGEWDLLAAWRLARMVRATGAALVHAHDAHGVSLGGRAARWGGGVPCICTRRVDFPIRSPGKYRRLARVICISEATRRVCLEAGLAEERLPVVMSGIDLERVRAAAGNSEALRAELAPAKKKPLLLLNVASLTDHKGQRYLLEAMPAVVAKLPQTVLVIAGTGELEGALKQQANLLALDEDVVFAGFREDVPALLHACDLFVMASHLEGLCTSVMDAMAAGKAVVATRAGGLPELVEDGRTGLLVPPRDAQALSAAILDLLADRKKRERFGAAAREVAAKRFGHERMVEGTVRVYRELCPTLSGGEGR